MRKVAGLCIFHYIYRRHTFVSVGMTFLGFVVVVILPHPFKWTLLSHVSQVTYTCHYSYGTNKWKNGCILQEYMILSLSMIWYKINHVCDAYNTNPAVLPKVFLGQSVRIMINIDSVKTDKAWPTVIANGIRMVVRSHLWPLLQTWFNFNPSMDE